MDYVQEISRRQRNILAALLLGNVEEPDEQVENMSQPDTSIRVATKRQRTQEFSLQGQKTPFMAQAEEWELLRSAESYERGRQADPRQKERSAAQVEQESYRVIEPGGEETDGKPEKQLEMRAAEQTLYREADTVWRTSMTNHAEEHTTVFAGPGIAGSLEAAALSRIFQRDARRYDGSFRTD